MDATGESVGKVSKILALMESSALLCLSTLLEASSAFAELSLLEGNKIWRKCVVFRCKINDKFFIQC